MKKIIIIIITFLSFSCIGSKEYLTNQFDSKRGKKSLCTLDVPNYQMFTQEFLKEKIQKYNFTLVSIKLKYGCKYGQPGYYVQSFSYMPMDKESWKQAIEQK